MTTISTFYPSQAGARTLRDAKPLYVREHQVEVHLYDMGDGPRVSVVIGLVIPFDGELPQGMVWMSDEFVAWVRDIAAQRAAELDAADAALVAKFEEILNAEGEVQVAMTGSALGMTYRDRARNARQLPKRRAALSDLLDALKPREMRAYGIYRKRQLGY